MRDLESERPQRARGKREPLLLQQRLNEQVFWPSIIIIAACAALLIWAPVGLESHRPGLSVILAGTGLILVLTFVFRLRAYAQCREDGLRIQLPFCHLTVPYEEIRATRPTDFYRMFPPKEQPLLQRHFLDPLWGKTVIVLDLAELPKPQSWLRLWMSRYMLCPDTVGLVLAVRDWIAFRTELDDFRSKHRRYRY